MPNRKATITRQTKETDIKLTLDLDGTGQAEIATGIGFFDHMLHLIAVHGLFDLTVEAAGDLHVDAHHTIEDVGIVLGQALDQALGDRSGIVRMGSATVPMDDSLAQVVVDLSGRPYAVVDAQFDMPFVGEMPTTLVRHVLETVAFNGKLNLHARVLDGWDDHHKAEALFKALGRALDAATQLDPRRSGIPSSKGTLTD
ncbi:MAG: imidazoleglycerol-phosphate dehydratase HisB [Anaerolineae bacterium]|nr:imidazoleglycerol-phosphate dehydratase HisB [Anaerolineae bacterium]